MTYFKWKIDDFLVNWKNKKKKYPDIKFGIKFVNGNIGFQDNIYTFPYFCAFLLRRYLEIN